MDDLLYILIGVAWVAYSLYTNKQKQDRKKAARENQGNPQPQQPHPVRSILEEILMGGEVKPLTHPEEDEFEDFETEPKTVLAAPVKYTTETEAKSLEVIEDEVPVNYFEKEYAGRKDNNEEVAWIKKETDKEIEEWSFTIAGDFDVKKAVIYAEILNPRYF
ncbi:MAG: hypothetical protein CVU14_02420 [Bacteroidetes bacterium HGW-Bacteroidetes-9]|jgi:hypothetical protein|nr:MAG: hypothetical protein CVU14_02420 [Bacteroidetes bacterium HGW-Bacteroidetes-9]